MRRFSMIALLVTAAVAAAGVATFAQTPSGEPKVDPRALGYARETVKTLDDVYKTAIVVFTDKFVSEEGDVPAGAFAVPWMEEVTKHGSHTVRLIDVTGEPIDDKNVAKTDFEKAAVKKIVEGEAYVERTATVEGKPVLRVATAVPVVMDKCLMCHPNYKDVPKGHAIGAITYEIQIR